MLRSVAVAFALSFVGAQAALAADMPVKAAPLPVVQPVNWSGCYLGLNAGGLWGRSSMNASVPSVSSGGVTTAAASADFGTQSGSSFVGGGQLGCRWQTTPNFVFGVEADLDGSSASMGGTATLPVTAPFIATDSASLKTRWQASARVSAGYAWDRWLAYLTTGVAFANAEMSGNYPAIGIFPASSGSSNTTRTGFTIGGGVAYKIDPLWDLGAEYRYTTYASSSFGLGSFAAICAGAVCTTTPVTGNADLKTHQVTLRLNYKFTR